MVIGIPHPRLTMRGTLFAIAIVGSLLVLHDSVVMSGPSVYVPVSASVAGVFALGGMRHPWFFLTVLLLFSLSSPTVHDSSGHEMFGGCCWGGWVLGTIAGGITRLFTAWKAANANAQGAGEPR